VKILVVDDDVMDRTLIQEFLSIRGYVVITCDGGQAVEKILQCKPDLVLLDVRMSPQNGVDVARHVRSQGLDACIVLMSGAERDQIRELEGVNVEGLGVVGFLEKAWLTKSLQTQLYKFLRACQQRRQKKEAAG
jgi:CheY-like chemotaxis protein